MERKKRFTHTIIITKDTPLPDLHEKMWTGVGSQTTPEPMCRFMSCISYVLGYMGYGLRSGRAKGADEAAESGVPPYMEKHAEIYLPKKNFGKPTHCRSFYIEDSNIKMDAIELIRKHNIHESWENLLNSHGNSFAVSAHIRNVFQNLGILNRAESLSRFLICWTKDGAKTFEETTQNTGGTRTAIRIACLFDIPVFNLATTEDAERLLAMVHETALKIDIPFDIPTMEELQPYIKRPSIAQSNRH